MARTTLMKTATACVITTQKIATMQTIITTLIQTVMVYAITIHQESITRMASTVKTDVTDKIVCSFVKKVYII